jgi:hypothetical protein
MKPVSDAAGMMLTGENTSKNMFQHHFFNTNLTSGAGSILGHGGEMSGINRLKYGITELCLNSLFLHRCQYVRDRYRQEPVN